MTDLPGIQHRDGSARSICRRPVEIKAEVSSTKVPSALGFASAECTLNSIRLIDIKADEGYSGSNLDRPGLQAALQMIRRGRANTLLVAKLDRLSRSLRDVCTLVEELFSDERNHLLSLCGMVNTHTAAAWRGMMPCAVRTEFGGRIMN